MLKRKNMKSKHYYLEQKAGEKVIRRVPTTLRTAEQDREKIEYMAPKDHKIFFVVSSEKEKVIN